MRTLIDAVFQPSRRESIVLSTFEQDFRAGDLFDETIRFADRLADAAGLTGKRVVLLVPDPFLFAAAVFAVNRLGGVAVPLSVMLREGDLKAILDFVVPHGVIAVSEHQGIPFAGIVEGWQAGNGTKCDLLERKPSGEWIRRTLEGEEVPADDPPGDIIFFTSGSTGQPKGIVAGADSLLGYLDVYPRLLNAAPGDRLFNIPPLTMMAGFCGLLSAIHSAFRIVVPDRFDWPGIARAMKRTACTKILTTPSILKAMYGMTRHLEPEAFARLEECYLVGEMVAADTLNEFADLQHAKFVGVFALSEAGGVMTADLRSGPEWVPDPSVRLRLHEEDGLNELLVRTPTLFKGYYRQPDLTRDSLTEDGYLRTGDLAALNERGHYVIVGRKKDIIKKGGAQIVPAEIENVLASCPGVRQAAVIGAPHRVFGEQIVAYITVEYPIDIDDVYHHCMKRIAGYKVPDHIVTIDAMPLVSGKTDKKALRERFRTEMPG